MEEPKSYSNFIKLGVILAGVALFAGYVYMFNTVIEMKRLYVNQQETLKDLRAFKDAVMQQVNPQQAVPQEVPAPKQ